MNVNKIYNFLFSLRLLADNEKSIQKKIYDCLVSEFGEKNIDKEVYLDKESIIDFIVFGDIGIEVKISCSKREIYRQCERYCGFDQIKTLILFSNTSMGFPETILGKKTYIINFGKSWL